ncbi:nucleotidyltransferase domain-containing protein [Thermus scotoductus]|uniref:DNA polymerase III subunit beta n=2 Tax=Thermus TaxID=270 RepID=A0A430S2Z0_THESC|nr:nucleotidyltransferase domain-containing protein [Thermus scotoductus]RTG91725.1 DNA polymerase III subunit beta [Thermus scotoductus]RTH28104.1 DNA polymerase III subunit beta [Thermus scotoductus]
MSLERALAQRAKEREALIQMARRYAERVRARLKEARVFLYGSVARGDFNLESDLDLLVVAPSLPKDPLERARLLFALREGPEEPKGLLPEEFALLEAQGKLWFLEGALEL